MLLIFLRNRLFSFVLELRIFLQYPLKILGFSPLNIDLMVKVSAQAYYDALILDLR